MVMRARGFVVSGFTGFRVLGFMGSWFWVLGFSGYRLWVIFWVPGFGVFGYWYGPCQVHEVLAERLAESDRR